MKLFFRTSIKGALTGGGVAIALSAATLLGGCFGPGLEERPVSELVEMLQGEEESDAISAASALRQKGDPAAIDPLIDAATNSEFASVRRQSTMALQWFDDPKAIAALVVLMKDGDGEIAGAAQQGLKFAAGQSYQTIGAGMKAAKEENPDAYETAFSVLEGMMESPEEFEVSNAITAIGQTGDPRAGELLVKKMATATDYQKGKLITALGQIDSPESVAALKTAATDENSVVAKAASTALRSLGYVDLDLLKAELETLGTRPGAIATLGKMDTPESLQLLKAQLESPSGDRKQVIQALGNRSEPEAIEALFNFMRGKGLRSPEVISTLQLIGNVGKRSQDPQVPKAIINAYRTNDLPKGAVVSALGTIGDAAYGPAQGLLSHPEPKMEELGVAVLGVIGKEDAIAPLTAKLTDWEVAPAAGTSLKQLGWEPTKDREKVLMWLAARDKAQLTANWDTTKTVLLSEAGSGNVDAVANALYGFLGIGNASVIPDLKQNLNARGNKDIALVYLNCGQPELEAAAQDWAKRNGYQVIKTPGVSNSRKWGSL